MRPVMCGLVGTLLLAIITSMVTAFLHVGPAIAFLAGLPAGVIGMLGGLYLGGYFDGEAL